MGCVQHDIEHVKDRNTTVRQPVSVWEARKTGLNAFEQLKEPATPKCIRKTLLEV